MAELAISHVHLGGGGGEQLEVVPGDDSSYTATIRYSVKGWYDIGAPERFHSLDM